MDYSKYIKFYPDFPIKGVNFVDIIPFIQDKELFRSLCDDLTAMCLAPNIAAPEARGFLFGAGMLYGPNPIQNLIVKYRPAECREEDVNQVLYCLYALEMDLEKHTFIEDDVLIPAATRMEERVAVSKETEKLSAREKEILVSVAQGKLNKEIADEHNISINTVTTHRKNITRKIGIKTVAGLTVYALLNNLIDMNAIE